MSDLWEGCSPEKEGSEGLFSISLRDFRFLIVDVYSRYLI